MIEDMYLKLMNLDNAYHYHELKLIENPHTHQI